MMPLFIINIHGFLDLEYRGYNMGNLYYKVKLYLEENGKTES